MPPNLQDMEQTPKPAFLFQTKDERYVASEYRTSTCGSTVRNDLCFVQFVTDCIKIKKKEVFKALQQLLQDLLLLLKGPSHPFKTLTKITPSQQLEKSSFFRPTIQGNVIGHPRAAWGTIAQFGRTFRQNNPSGISCLFCCFGLNR